MISTTVRLTWREDLGALEGGRGQRTVVDVKGRRSVVLLGRLPEVLRERQPLRILAVRPTVAARD